MIADRYAVTCTNCILSKSGMNAAAVFGATKCELLVHGFAGCYSLKEK